MLLGELEKIDGETKKYDIDFVKVTFNDCKDDPIEATKVEDNDEAADYGIELLPALMYFENKIPSLYDEDLANVSGDTGSGGGGGGPLFS